MKLGWIASLGALAVACAGTPVVPAEPPRGTGWRTQHQRYVVGQADTRTAAYAGNVPIALTSYSARSAMVDETAADAKPVLAPGVLATRARLAAGVKEVARR